MTSSSARAPSTEEGATAVPRESPLKPLRSRKERARRAPWGESTAGIARWGSAVSVREVGDDRAPVRERTFREEPLDLAARRHAHAGALDHVVPAAAPGRA